jgi:choline dehydrogenase-like flavoprotein
MTTSESEDPVPEAKKGMSAGVETQVVVIGSGAGGAAVAGELCRHGIPTIVVEAGPQRTWPFGSHVRNRNPSEQGLLQYHDALNGALTFPSGGAGSGSAFKDFKVIHAVGGMLSRIGLAFAQHPM